MAEKLKQKSAGNDTTEMAADKRFGRYRKENKQTIREPERKLNEKLEQLRKVWEKFEFSCVDLGNDPSEGKKRNYRNALIALRGMPMTAKDIEGFSLAVLPNVFQKWDGVGDKAGFLLSAMINNCMERDFIVHTQHIAFELNYLGYRNSKNIIVIGNAGSGLGCEMSKGSILVKGSVTNYVGIDMNGGSITVEGDAGYEVGSSMKTGIIIIQGNTSHSVGADMKGGQIYIEGNIESIARSNVDYIKHGKIFHKGKLIVDK